MKDIAYQQRAIGELTDKIVRLLNINEPRQKVVFKAPTGSGKTYMTAKSMEAVAERLKTDSRNRYEAVAFVWIAPNRLHSQAYESLCRLFEETRTLNPIMFDSISDDSLTHGDVLCLNWGSIHSEDNIMVRDTENGRNLWSVIENTRRNGTAIVAVIDEEHLHWSSTADRAATVLRRLKPIVEVRVSATPKTVSPHTVFIHRKEAVEAQMIKTGLVINPDITVTESQELETYLIDEALKKRDLLAKCYEEMNKEIKPLLLIQLPNDTVTISAEDKTFREEIVTYLREQYVITTDSGELAIWLSDKSDKQNLEGIEKPDSKVKVLLFKEAIAKGWDCPRAAVLLIYRKLDSKEFAIQTLGRILRMPEQCHYFNPLLNIGYVYTNISKSKILVTGETEDYWKNELIPATRRKNLNNIKLASVYEFYAASDRNRLGTDFRKFLYDYIKRHWLTATPPPKLFSVDEDGAMIIHQASLTDFGEDTDSNRQQLEAKHRIRFDVRGETINIPRDLNIQNEEKEIKVTDSVEYTRSRDKIYKIYIDYCRSLLTHYEKAASTPILAEAIINVMEELFAVSEWDTPRVILSVKPVNNNQKFTDVLTRCLDEYYEIVKLRKIRAKERSFTPWMWEVPESRTYNGVTNEAVPEVKEHALMPFVRLKSASTQEKNFEEYLEEKAEYIDWWYKNGDNGRAHYAIGYTKSNGEKSLFYVDFIIRLKNGEVFLLDTKKGLIDRDVVEKHNALIDYINHPDNKEKKLHGGIIVKDRFGNWVYSTAHIDNASELDNPVDWNLFDPQLYR